jgi:hypothetical protein
MKLEFHHINFVSEDVDRLHDCLIVPKVNTEDAKQAFYSAYAHFHSKRPLLSVE